MTTPDIARPGRVGRRDMLAEMPQEELIAKWEEFFEDQGYGSRIIAVADRYPEARSLDVPFEELNRFDTDMAIHLLRHPLNVLTAGEEAIRRLAPPGDEAVQIHLRIKGVPRDRRVQIRDLRAKHLGQFLAVEGLVRKSTEVRPRVVGALFQCLRCGTILKEEQEEQAFREPLECYEDQGGCGRSASATKFKLLTETSLFLDTQKIEVQEAPEGLRGGEEPQRLSAYIEDDLTGRINPGMRVVLNGILRSSQRGRPGAKSTLFDIFLDANSVELEQVEFEEIEVSEEDARQIREAASSPDIFRMTVNSIAPSIYGMHAEKEALALQLFSGIPKVMPDGRRIRGDVHILMVGDPGTGKSELLSYMSRLSPRGIYATGKAASAAGLCVGGESVVATDRGMATIEGLAKSYFPQSQQQRPLEIRAASGTVATFDERNAMVMRPLRNVWRIRSPRVVLRVTTAAGLTLRVTPATKLLVDHAMGQSWMRSRFLRKGMRIATTQALPSVAQQPPLIISLLRDVGSRIVVEVSPEFVNRVLSGLRARSGTLREAALRLLIDEDALYHRWRKGRHAIPLEPLMRAARAAGIDDEEVARSIRTFSQAAGHRITLPVVLDKRLAYFAGLIAGDGSVEETPDAGFSIRFSNTNETLIQDYAELARSLFDVSVAFTPQRPSRSATSRFHSKLVAVILRALGIPTSPKSTTLTIPGLLMNATSETLGSYLRGLYDTDGTIAERVNGGNCISFSTTGSALAQRLQMALLRFGIASRIRPRSRPGHRAIRRDGKVIESQHDQFVVDIYGWSSFARFREHVGFGHPEKARRLAAMVRKTPHSNVDLISSAGPHLREVREALGLDRNEAYGRRARFGAAVEAGRAAAGHETLTDLVDSIEARYRSGEWRGPRLRLPPRLLDQIGDFFQERALGPMAVSHLLFISPESANECFFRASRPRSPIPSTVLEQTARILRILSAPFADEIAAELRPIVRRVEKVGRRLAFIRNLASSDIRWDPVKTLDFTATEEPTVYDLTVHDAHAFVANGILVHNTAAAVRDEFGEGRWTLEAGALVLADKGLACLHPKSTVYYEGEWHSISSLMEDQPTTSAIAGGRRIEIRFLDGETLAFDSRSKSIVAAPVSLVSRRWYEGPVLHVSLVSGSELRLTPEHIVLDGVRGLWTPLQAMGPSSCLMVLKHTPRASATWKAQAHDNVGGNGQTDVLVPYERSEELALERISRLRMEMYRGYVYDMHVPSEGNFLCDGVVVHNCIDEIEKMNPQDRSAIHEALEQQRISVAKAGITAVLQARCAVLAAANPQFGRFDIHKYLSEQIALEPPLLSRFDAIFAILDRPETERDRQMADHILMGHRVGEIAERRREGLTAPEDREVEAPYTPHFTPEFLRKYVAHARRIYPVMTDEAMDAIKKKYLEIRKLGESPESSVPITPRQLESIIRFSEASARLRLSEVVSIEDADRAVRIVEYWMGKVAGEEGGRLDIDIIQTGISQSQREQIITLRDVINELAGPEGVADYEDIVRLAQERGIPPAKVDTWLKRWSQEGEIYSPAKNKYKLVERL